MKTYLQGPAMFVLGLSAVLFFSLGCESERDSSVPDPSSPGARPLPTNSVSSASEQLLIYGTAALTDGSDTTVGGAISATDDGNFAGTVAWDTTESLEAYFMEASTPGKQGAVSGTSPLSPNVTVSSGQDWTLHIANSSGTNVSILYQVSFVP